MAKIYGNAQEFRRILGCHLENGKSVTEMAELHSISRSLPPACIRVGNFYAMDGSSRLTLADTLVNGIVTFILL